MKITFLQSNKILRTQNYNQLKKEKLYCFEYTIKFWTHLYLCRNSDSLGIALETSRISIINSLVEQSFVICKLYDDLYLASVYIRQSQIFMVQARGCSVWDRVYSSCKHQSTDCYRIDKFAYVFICKFTERDGNDQT